LFKSKQRTAAAWAKGLMLGKAVGAKDERQRIIGELEANYLFALESLNKEWSLHEMERAEILVQLIKSLRGQKDE
jgi:hypothetical protein